MLYNLIINSCAIIIIIIYKFRNEFDADLVSIKPHILNLEKSFQRLGGDAD